MVRTHAPHCQLDIAYNQASQQIPGGKIPDGDSVQIREISFLVPFIVWIALQPDRLPVISGHAIRAGGDPGVRGVSCFRIQQCLLKRPGAESAVNEDSFSPVFHFAVRKDLPDGQRKNIQGFHFVEIRCVFPGDGNGDLVISQQPESGYGGSHPLVISLPSCDPAAVIPQSGCFLQFPGRQQQKAEGIILRRNRSPVGIGQVPGNGKSIGVVLSVLQHGGDHL